MKYLLIIAAIIACASCGLIGYALQPEPVIITVWMAPELHILRPPPEIREVLVETDIILYENREMREFESKQDLAQFLGGITLLYSAEKDCDDYARTLWEVAVGQGYEVHCQYQAGWNGGHMFCWTPVKGVAYKIDTDLSVSYWFPLD